MKKLLIICSFIVLASISTNQAFSNDTGGIWGPGSYLERCYHNDAYLGDISPMQISLGLTCDDVFAWNINNEHQHSTEYTFKYIYRNGVQVPVHEKSVHSVEDCVVTSTPFF
ncbi:MAG: hypothetical protein HWD86_06565 [Kangiellaceae bacterium]|nr:hypothetical protein [Kangiellaceae bacterium]